MNRKQFYALQGAVEKASARAEIAQHCYGNRTSEVARFLATSDALKAAEAVRKLVYEIGAERSGADG